MEASKSVTLRTSMFEKKKSNIKEAEWSGNCPSDICYLNERDKLQSLWVINKLVHKCSS